MNIAYLGLGIMGSGMASNLIGAGHNVTVWNRTKEKAEPLVDKGATLADTPAEAIKNAELIMYSFSNDEAVKEVVFGDDGILSAVQEGQIAVNMSTVYPDLSRQEADAYKEKGVSFLDAPVFGSKDESANGALWIVVGGDADVLDKVKPAFDPLSATVHHMGGVGKGATMKLVGNLMVTSMLETLGEAMTLATKAGLDPKDVLDVIHVTDFRSPTYDGMGQALAQRDFSVKFALKHLLKDTNLIAQLAQDYDVPITAAAVARENTKAAFNQGWGDENANALIKVLEQGAGVTVQG